MAEVWPKEFIKSEYLLQINLRKLECKLIYPFKL